MEQGGNCGFHQAPFNLKDTNLIFSKSFSFDIFMPVMNTQIKKILANVSLGLVIQIQINATQQEQPTKLSENFDEVKVKSLKINESIYVLKSEGGGVVGGNVGVCVGKDGTFIIDDSFAKLSDKFKNAISKLTDKKVNFVVNTHFHFDHTDGNESFGKDGAIIISQANSRSRMMKDIVFQLIKKRQNAYSEVGLPKITLDKELKFHYNGHTINILHFGPAHTDGDLVIQFKESNVVHLGDLLIDYGFPFIDVPNGGSVDGFIETLENISNMINDETVIIPGHGDIAKKSDLLEFKKMLKTIRDRISKGIEDGKTLGQIAESNPTKGFELGGPIPVNEFVKIIYSSLVN